MSRSPSVVRRIAKSWGKSPRTIERWCQSGKIPGAYRTKRGWGVRKRPYAKFFYAELSRRVMKKWRKLRRNHGVTPSTFTLVTGGITTDDFRAATERPDWLKEHYPDKWKLLCDPSRDLLTDVHPHAKEFVNQPNAALLVARELLLSHGIEVTPGNLADRLHICPTTLCNHFGKENVQKACRGEQDLIPSEYRHNRTRKWQQFGNARFAT
jgi:hypothetical protein